MKTIEIHFDEEINGYVITMPDWVTLEMLKDWKFRFDKMLAETSHKSEYSLLIDTGRHEFESVDCLKFLREYLSEKPEFKNMIKKGAFVGPQKYVSPHVESDLEAYFNDYHEAHDWLKGE